MVAGGKPAKPRTTLTITRGGKAVLALSLTGLVGYCCVPPKVPDAPPPAPTVIVDAAPDPPDVVDADGAEPERCEYVTPRARSARRPVPRIVGGHTAKEGAWPFAVSINAGTHHYCGASIIGKRWILTAGHCQVWPGDMARIGSVDRREARQIAIAESRIHPLFSAATLKWDVAVARLSEPVDVEPAQLGREITEGVNADVIGWGRLSEGGPVTNFLQEVSVKPIGQATCRANYGDIDDTQTCWGSGSAADSCSGDSGGPLLQLQPSGHVQIGIVSFGRGCAREEGGVYTRVTHPEVRAWIERCTR